MDVAVQVVALGSVQPPSSVLLHLLACLWVCALDAVHLLRGGRRRPALCWRTHPMEVRDV